MDICVAPRRHAVLRVLRTFTLANELSVQPVSRQTLTIGLTLFSVIYISTCIFPLLDSLGEPPPGLLPLHDSLYYVIITITTVGYGDITPESTLGRMASLAMVGIARAAIRP